MVVPVVVESFGGIGTRALRALKFAARRAGDKKRGRDGTKYSRTCWSVDLQTVSGRGGVQLPSVLTVF